MKKSKMVRLDDPAEKRDREGYKTEGRPHQGRMGMYDHSDSEDDFPSDVRDDDDDDIEEQLEQFRHMEYVEEDERRAHPQMPNQPMASSSSARHQNVPPVVELPN
jgi:hypothetical protein